MDKKVAIKSFNYRHEAEPLRKLLESSGIDVFVTSDDCGTVYPALALAGGVYLMVWESDLERAANIIKEAERGISE